MEMEIYAGFMVEQVARAEEAGGVASRQYNARKGKMRFLSLSFGPEMAHSDKGPPATG